MSFSELKQKCIARRADAISKIFTSILSVSSKSAGEFVQQIPLFKLNFKMSVIQVPVLERKPNHVS